MGSLRVLDFGSVAPLRSQTLWHAVAHGVSAGEPPTLSFMQPAAPYVSIGFHSSIEAVDRRACAARGLPVFRRMVGGGPVYLDPGQYFFQITVPGHRAPAGRRAALRALLEPAVAAFQAAGVDAHLDEEGEISVGDRKVCGHAAGQIGDAVVVVGNLITSFDHAAAAGVLAAPRPAARVELLRLMRRYVTATPADPPVFRQGAIAAYAEALDLRPEPGRLAPSEEEHLAELDGRFVTEEWVAGDPVPAAPVWKAKVRSGVWVLAAGEGPTYVVAAVAHGRIERIHVEDADLDGARSRLEAGLAGLPLSAARPALASFGAPGVRVAAVLDRVTA